MFNEKKTKNESVQEESPIVGVDLSNGPDFSTKQTGVRKKFADVISSKPLNFREEPDGKILTTLKEGTKLEVKGVQSSDGKWINVVYNGTRGWVVSEYLGPIYFEVKSDDQHSDDN